MSTEGVRPSSSSMICTRPMPGYMDTYIAPNQPAPKEKKKPGGTPSFGIRILIKNKSYGESQAVLRPSRR